MGKTWLIRELARIEKIPLVEINFELQPSAKAAFATPDPADILRQLTLIGFPLAAGGLLFLDEIQECPEAITALRYFHELQPHIPLIATGSLLEFAMDAAEFSMPVGRIESLWLHPMDFTEFLLAKSKPDLADAISSLGPGESLPPAAHTVALSLLRDYFFTGGMPEALRESIENADPSACRRAQLSILQTYRRDFAKYAPRIPADLAENLFLRTPGLVGERLKFSNIDPDRRAASVRQALSALEKAGVVRQITHSSGQGLPLAAQANPRLVKLAFLDIGLLHAALRIDSELVAQPDLLGIQRFAKPSTAKPKWTSSLPWVHTSFRLKSNPAPQARSKASTSSFKAIPPPPTESGFIPHRVTATLASAISPFMQPAPHLPHAPCSGCL